MPSSKRKPTRSNPSITGIFEKHLQFLRQDMGLANTSIIKVAVADLAKRRGFVAPPEPSPTKKKPGA